MKFCRALLVSSAFAAFVFAQNGPVAFEVASVKPAGGGISGIRTYPGGRLAARSVSLKALIEYAWSAQPNQVSGGTAWVESQPWDLDAKAVGSVPTAQIKEMLQSLLKERFQLRMREETKEAPIFSLVQNDKIKQQESSADCDTADTECGEIVRTFNQVTGRRVTMRQLADALSMIVERTVVDRTGLSGFFDLKLTWTPDKIRELQTSTGKPVMLNGQVLDTNGPTIYTAVKEQLGLKLEPGKGPAHDIVIESAEKASEN
jgi:uncharacterized protein (TIGR03435 family)